MELSQVLRCVPVIKDTQGQIALRVMEQSFISRLVTRVYCVSMVIYNLMEPVSVIQLIKDYHVVHVIVDFHKKMMDLV